MVGLQARCKLFHFFQITTDTWFILFLFYCYVVLSSAVLGCADLCCVVLGWLGCAVLFCALLGWVVPCRVGLGWAVLCSVGLCIFYLLHYYMYLS